MNDQGLLQKPEVNIRCKHGCSAMTSLTAFTMNLRMTKLRPGSDNADAVAAIVRDKEATSAKGKPIQPNWVFKAGARSGTAIATKHLIPVSCVGRDDSGGTIHAADVKADRVTGEQGSSGRVHEKQIICIVDGQTPGAHAGAGGWAAISAKAILAIARHHTAYARCGVHANNPVLDSVGDEEIVMSIDCYRSGVY